MFAVQILLNAALLFTANAQTVMSVKTTLANHQYKDLSVATIKQWTPANSETFVKDLAPYVLDRKWGSFKPFKEILQHQGKDYVLEESQLDVRGTSIPYWVVYHQSTPASEKSRALQIGLPSMTDYPPGEAINVLAQKLWLDKGGVVVLSPLIVDDPMQLLSGSQRDKQQLYQKWADQFGIIGRHILRSKKAGSIAMEAPKDTLFFAAYVAIRYGEVYSRVLVVQPEVSPAVATALTPPTAKIWPDYTIQDWYQTLITQEWNEQAKLQSKTPRVPPVFIAVDSQNTFAGKMAYGFLQSRGMLAEYTEVPLWVHSETAAKTVRFQALKYNYLMTAPQQVYTEAPPPKPAKKSKKKKHKSTNL